MLCYQAIRVEGNLRSRGSDEVENGADRVFSIGSICQCSLISYEQGDMYLYASGSNVNINKHISGYRYDFIRKSDYWRLKFRKGLATLVEVMETT